MRHRLARVTAIFFWAVSHLASGAAVVKVADYGAVPDDGKNDISGLKAAAGACDGQSDVRLIFEEGTYDLFAPEGAGRKRNGGFPPFLSFNGIEGLAVEGNGALLCGRVKAAMFVFRNCHNIDIRRLTIDYNPPPFSSGEVVAAEGKHFDLQVPPPHEASDGLRAEAVLEYDRRKRRLARHGYDLYQLGFAKKSRLLRPGVMRVFVRGKPPKPGMSVIVRHQVYQFNAFTFRGCSGVKLSDTSIYTAPGMGLYAHDSRDFELKRLNVRPRPDSDRWMSTTADATHFNTCRGTIRIEDCVFDGMGDDATNLHSMFMTVTRRIDERSLGLTVKARGTRLTPTEPKPDDRFEFGGGATPLVPYAEAVVASAAVNKDARELVLTFTAPLPEQVAEGHVAANASACPKVRVRRCLVRNNRARGMLIQTRDVVIEDCSFEYCSGAALHITCDVNYWHEAIGVRDVIVRRNRFVGCDFGAGRRGATIDVFAEDGPRIAPAGVHHGVTIAGNSITDADGSAIRINSVDGAEVTDNTIVRPGDVAITVNDALNVRIAGNKLTGADSGGIELKAGCDRKTITIEDNTGF